MSPAKKITDTPNMHMEHLRQQLPEKVIARMDAYVHHPARVRWMKAALKGDYKSACKHWCSMEHADRWQHQPSYSPSAKDPVQNQRILIESLFTETGLDSELGSDLLFEDDFEKLPVSVRKAAVQYLYAVAPTFGLSAFTLTARHANTEAFTRLLTPVLDPAHKVRMPVGLVSFANRSSDGIRYLLNIGDGEWGCPEGARKGDLNDLINKRSGLGAYLSTLIALSTSDENKVPLIARCLDAYQLRWFFSLHYRKFKDIWGEQAHTVLSVVLGVTNDEVELALNRMRGCLERSDALYALIDQACKQGTNGQVEYWEQDHEGVHQMHSLIEQGASLAHERDHSLEMLAEAHQWNVLLQVARTLPGHSDQDAVRIAQAPDWVWQQLFLDGFAPQAPKMLRDLEDGWGDWQENCPAWSFIENHRDDALRLCLDHPYAPLPAVIKQGKRTRAPVLERALEEADPEKNERGLDDGAKAQIRLLIERGARLDHIQQDTPEPIRAMHIAPEVLAYAQSVEEALTLEGTVQAAPERAPKAPRGL